MKKTPMNMMTPDFSPVVKMMAMQTRMAIEMNQSMMKLALMPWQGMPCLKVGFGNVCAPSGAKAAAKAPSKPAAKPAAKAAPVAEAAPKAAPKPVAKPAPKPAPKAEAAPAAKVDAAPVKKVEKTAAPKPVAKPVEAKPAGKKPVESAASDKKPAAKPVAKADAKTDTKPEAKPAPKTAAAPAAAPAAKGPVAPEFLKAATGKADDLTALKGVGPKLAETLASKGIYHYAQIAAWTPENVAWVDENIAGVRGRAAKNGWVAQAAKLAK